MAVMFRRQQPKDGGHDGAKPYDRLRAMALGAVAKGLQSPGEDHPDVSGLVVDIPAQEGFATIVALTDDTTSMYMSTGRGLLGQADARMWHQRRKRCFPLLRPNSEHSHGPAIRTSRLPAKFAFHLLSASVRATKTSLQAVFGAAPARVHRVIAATQDVISAIRSSTPQGSRDSSR